MKRRRSHFNNFPTSSLFVLMEQYTVELEKLENKLLNSKDNLLLKERIKQIKLVIVVARNIIIERYLEANTSFNETAKLLVESEGIKESVYKELFTLKAIQTDEIISFDLLNLAINKLDISDLMLIIRTRENGICFDLALKRYDEMIFDVEPEVYNEYVMKKVLDGRRNKNDKY